LAGRGDSGYAIARELALSGARLALTSRRLDALERARARLLESGCAAPEDVWVHPCDVSVEPTVREMVTVATAHFGRIDVLVNGAGIIMVGPLMSQTLDSFHEAMGVNFFGALHATLALLPQMLERGEGAIVNISSIGGKLPSLIFCLTWRASSPLPAGRKACGRSLPAKGFVSPPFLLASCAPAPTSRRALPVTRRGVSLVCHRRQPTRNRNQRHRCGKNNRARFGRWLGRNLDWPASNRRRAPFQYRSRANRDLAFDRE
jgi:hypothetical protein